MKLTNSVVKHKFNYTFVISTLKEDKNVINFIYGSFLDKNGISQTIYKTQIVRGTIDGIANMLFKYCINNPSALSSDDGYVLQYGAGGYGWSPSISTISGAYIPGTSVFSSSASTLSPSTISYYKKFLSYGTASYDNELLEEVPQLPKIKYNNLQLSLDHNNKPYMTFSVYGKTEKLIQKAFNDIKATYIFE